MKSILATVILGAWLAGCSIPKPMKNDDIIRETKKCTDAGMGTNTLVNGNGEIVEVQCAPKEKPSPK